MGLTEPPGLELEGQEQGVFPGSYPGGEVLAGPRSQRQGEAEAPGRTWSFPKRLWPATVGNETQASAVASCLSLRPSGPTPAGIAGLGHRQWMEVTLRHRGIVY